MPDPPLTTAPVCSEHVRGAHRARWLSTVDEAYAEMRALIDAARERICLETYILRAEGPGQWLRESLLQARARGVAVRMLVDAFGIEGLQPDYLQSLRDAGVDLHVFNPQRLLRRVFRNHRKLLVCDGEQAVVGGFNIGPEYAGDGVTQGWCDTGVRVAGPVARTLERSFEAMFALAPFTPRAIRRFRAVARQAVSEATGSADADAPVSLLVSGPVLPRGALSRALRLDLARARAIRIASGYFLPSLRIRRHLYRKARGRGRVQVLLAGRSDVPLARLAAEHLYTRLLRRHVRLHEYQPQILHAKLVIMDDVVYAGSCNLDRRSLHINYELLLRFDWPELAADARRWYAAALAHAVPVRRRAWRSSRTLWRRLLSRVAYWLLARIDPLVARRTFRTIS